MSYKVFIDGRAGTTGLQVQERLLAHPDIELINLAEDQRKNASARREAMAEADVAILCLPNEASIEAVALAEGLEVKLIDASTAFRIHPDWAYGFPEMAKGQRDLIASSSRIANVGCYATAMIAMIRPLIESGIIAPETQLNISAISGYTGGGKKMIEYFTNHEGPRHFAYASDLHHKHIPEVVHHAHLKTPPTFLPSVGDFDCGMLVQLPLVAAQMKSGTSRKDIVDIYAQHYVGEPFIKITPLDHRENAEGYLAPDALKGTNLLEIQVLGHDAKDGHILQAMIVARLDNLGKGAAGSAVQNLNLILGLDESKTL